MFANPFSTKTDDTSTVTALELNTAGADIAQALDGTGGGAYSLAAELELKGTGGVKINGAGVKIGTDGGNGLTQARITGTITRAGAARDCARAPTTVTDADQTIDLSSSERFEFTAPTGTRTYKLGETTGTIPIAGEEKILRFKNTNNHIIHIQRESTVGADIFSIAAGVFAVEMRVWFDGTVWNGGIYSANITPGADY